MASQEDVLKSLEAAAKVGAVATLNALNSAGGAIDIEADVLSASLGSVGPEVAALAKPFIHQVLASLIAKMA